MGYLEEREIIPEEMFPMLEEDEADSGQLGAEASLLADYLADLAEEETSPAGAGSKPDMGMLVALAPFLEQKELSKMMRKHFTGQASAAEEEEAAPQQGPDLKTIAGLAPFVDRKTLGEMVRACLSRQKITDPSVLVALAPHMDSQELSKILREHLPEWFGQQAAAREEESPTQRTETARQETVVDWSRPIPQPEERPASEPTPEGENPPPRREWPA